MSPAPARRCASRRRRATVWASALLSVLALGGTGCAVFDERQGEWIFRPTRDPWWGAGDWAPDVQETWIRYTTADGAAVSLQGRYLPGPHADSPALLYLHGARWDLSASQRRLERMRALGFSVLGIDYRGFGRSSDGPPSERRAYEDALAAWRWLATQQPSRPRYLFGHSLGSAIAVHLASEVDDARGLMLEGAFTSIPDVVATMRWGWLPIGPLITQRFDSASRIAALKLPVLVVHGSNDQLIAPALGRALYERIQAPKQFLLVEGGTHHDTNDRGQPQYREAMQTLFGLPAM